MSWIELHRTYEVLTPRRGYRMVTNLVSVQEQYIVDYFPSDDGKGAVVICVNSVLHVNETYDQLKGLLGGVSTSAATEAEEPE